MKKKTLDTVDSAQACAYLDITRADLLALREEGLAFCLSDGVQQAYPRDRLEITRYLLALGRDYGWNAATTAWYADLLFVSEVGRAILLPMHDQQAPVASHPVNWLETPYAVAVLEELGGGPSKSNAAIVTPLRSLMAVTVGEGQFWPDVDAVKESALYPIIAHLEASGVAIMGQGTAIARDLGTNFVTIMFAFLNIAPPISKEFSQLVAAAQKNLKGIAATQVNSTPDEQDFILKQPLIPVDKIYASKATEIHSSSPSETWDFKLGILKSQRRTIAIQIKLPMEADKPFVDNIVDMIRPFVGPFGARVVHLLYEIANDPPYFRNPAITIDTNQMLDRLGLKRDRRGIHRSKNRVRLRDALNAAHALEIVGELTTREDGRPVRKTFYRTVLSIIGATFDAEENAGLSTVELRTRGLPKTLQIKLNFYDGIRRPDGKLGDQHVMVPRLASPHQLPKANYSATHELLKAFLLFRYRQSQPDDRVLTLTRETALEKANITNKNARMATATLRKALDRLVADGTVEQYSPIPPSKRNESFIVVLTESIVNSFEADDE